jgi:hypothetical protein
VIYLLYEVITVVNIKNVLLFFVSVVSNNRYKK